MADSLYEAGVISNAMHDFFHAYYVAYEESNFDKADTIFQRILDIRDADKYDRQVQIAAIRERLMILRNKGHYETATVLALEALKRFSIDDAKGDNTAYDDYLDMYFTVGLGMTMHGEEENGESYYEKCYEMTSENSYEAIEEQTVHHVKKNQTTFLNIMLYISLSVAAVTIAASMFLIGHKITKDIEDQMQQIGVLEAIGYKSTEISLSYVYEYVITGGIGAVTGGIAAALFTPVMTYMSMAMMSRTVSIDTSFGRIFLVILLTLLAVILFALIKAGIIKSFPPMTAFRKGIKTHHFGRNFLPLEGLKKSINLRLALKKYTELCSRKKLGLQ
jgi:tetratricopeptide (TPR) repeat protein